MRFADLASFRVRVLRKRLVESSGSVGQEEAILGVVWAMRDSVEAAGVDPRSRPGRARRASSRPVVDEGGSGGGQIPG